MAKTGNKKDQQEHAEKSIGYKLTNEQFWAALEDANGLYSKCVELVKELYGIDISRQAVEQRATRNDESKARLKEIRQKVVDHAENRLFELVNHYDGNVSMKAIQLILKSKRAKDRGYNDKVEHEHTGEMSIKTVIVKTVAAGAKLASSERDVSED